MSAQVDQAWLAAHPLPPVGKGLDKEERGRVLVVGGSAMVPGAILLTGEAALRAGAGKVRIGTIEAAAMATGVAFPEGAVVGLPVDEAGEIAKAAVERLRDQSGGCDTLVLGPGMTCRPHTSELVSGLIGVLCDTATVLLDAGAITALRGGAAVLNGRKTRSILTPHHGELASLLEIEKDEIERDPAAAAIRAAREFGAIVALKSSDTVIADLEGQTVNYAGPAPGLGTAGSGDVLAGIIGGLLARGTEPWTAAGWGVWLHGQAGCAAERRMGTIGYLARELLPHIPGLLHGA